VSYDRGNYQDKWRIERIAKGVRQRLGLSQMDLLDPWRLAEAVPAHVFYPDDLIEEPLAMRARQINWDGFAFCFPDEEHLMVLLNPGRSVRRQRATLLEELAHHLLGHAPSRIFRDPVSALPRREFNKAQEEEAYDFGSVLLIPKEIIQHHVKVVRGTTEALADACGCSIELVELRIKRCRLWDRHQKNHPA
jgi:Zn-dependent peptidase ImmA (M78 family)